jgi:hypothetical protein
MPSLSLSLKLLQELCTQTDSLTWLLWTNLLVKIPDFLVKISERVPLQTTYWVPPPQARRNSVSSLQGNTAKKLKLQFLLYWNAAASKLDQPLSNLDPFSTLKPQPQLRRSSTWWSTTLAKDTCVQRVWYLYILLHINTCLMDQWWFKLDYKPWFHSRRRHMHTQCQQVLPCHLFGQTCYEEASTDHTRYCLYLTQTRPSGPLTFFVFCLHSLNTAVDQAAPQHDPNILCFLIFL